MSKGIEDKLTVLIKETFMRIETGNSCVQTKIGIRTIKKTYPSLYPPPPPPLGPLLFHSSYSFLHCWKTATKPMTLITSGLSLFLLTILWKIKRNCMSGLFCMAYLSKVGRKKHFFNFMVFKPLQAKIK